MLLKFIVLVFIIAILLRIFSPILNKDSLLVRLFNRYTFNVVPNTLGIISTIFGSGIALIYGGALLLGFFSGFYALYKGTDLLVSHIKWQVTSIKTEGEVLNADNKRNMSQALVRFSDQNGAQYEFVYTANYNGTEFTIGEILPVYYQKDAPLKSATLNNKGAYAGIAFLYFYGIAVSLFAIFVIGNVYRSIRKDRQKSRLEHEGILFSVKVTAVIPSGDYLIARAEYQPMFSKAVYYYESGRIELDAIDLDKLKGATAKVKILPKDPSTYLFYTEELADSVRK